ncbi:MAG: hypothetical protein AAB338_01905 [Patescibacteria group bacterium]
MPEEPKNPSDQKPVLLEPSKDIENLLKELPKIDSPKPIAPLLKPPPAPQITPPSFKAMEGTAKPQISPPPKLISPPVSNPSPPLPQGAKSFVRTMAEDLEAAKKGIKPEPKPFEIKPPPAIPKITPLPPPLEIPSAPQAKLGPAEKTRSLELPKIGPAPLARPPTARKFALSPKKLIIILIIIAAIFAGAWFFLTREPEKTAVFTPTPVPIPSPSPTPKTFSELIPSASQITIPSTQNFPTALTNRVNSLALFASGLTLLNLIDENSTPYSMNQIFEKLGITPPNGLLENLDSNEWIIAAYGQKESFDSRGLLTFNETPKPKIVFAAKIFDLILLRSALNNWESAMAADLKNLFDFDSKKATSETFLNNIYSGADIRYRNFPFADSTINYALVNLAKFNTDYFILTGSRESIYSTIDLLQTQ